MRNMKVSLCGALALTASLLVVGFALVGCGGSGDKSTASTNSTKNGRQPAAAQTSGATSADKGDTSIQNFGQAATGPDSSSAEAAVHGYLTARAAGDYSRACSYLSEAFQQQLAQLGSNLDKDKSSTCATTLQAMSASLPAQVRHDLGVVRVTAVRVSGDRAFVLYRGAHGVKSFIPVSKQGGSWRVAALAGSNLG
jgi:hypothetical protein